MHQKYYHYRRKLRKKNTCKVTSFLFTFSFQVIMKFWMIAMRPTTLSNNIFFFGGLFQKTQVNMDNQDHKAFLGQRDPKES